MKSYLIMMAVRLLEMHRVLKSTGSLYLHCDPTASHYLKTLMDSVFGPERFLNEITWKRSSAHSDSKQGMRRCGRIRDIFLVYTKGEGYRWNTRFTPYSEEYLREKYRHQDPDGRRFKDTDLSGANPGGDTSYEWRVKRRVAPKARVWEADPSDEWRLPKTGWEYGFVSPPPRRYWAYSHENLLQLDRDGLLYHTRSGRPRLKQYADEMSGVPLQDLWTDIPPINSQAQERVGYPTQKPLALLDRIIRASSNEGDVVLDPFAGCATACAWPPSAFTASGWGSTYRRKRLNWCRFASVRRSTCSTTSSRYAGPTSPGARILASCPATEPISTSYLESKKGCAEDVERCSRSGTSRLTISCRRVKAGAITWTTCNYSVGPVTAGRARERKRS